jgi:hypothetical protein
MARASLSTHSKEALAIYITIYNVHSNGYHPETLVALVYSLHSSSLMHSFSADMLNINVVVLYVARIELHVYLAQLLFTVEVLSSVDVRFCYPITSE